MRVILRSYIVLSLVLLVLFFITLKAQERGSGPGQRGGPDGMRRGFQSEEKFEEKEFLKLCQYLGLDKKQQKKANKLFEKMQKNIAKIFKEANREKIEQFEAGEKRIKIYMKYRQEFRKLLTDSQKEKYEALREKKLNSH